MDTSRHSLRMIRLRTIAIAMSPWILAALPVHAAEVFKTVDAEGHVVYTDHADPNAPKTAVQVNALNAKQAAKSAKLQAAQRAAEQQHKKQQALEVAKMARLDHDAKVQCDEAQKNFYALKATGATDAAAAMKREEARQSMVLACTD